MNLNAFAPSALAMILATACSPSNEDPPPVEVSRGAEPVCLGGPRVPVAQLEPRVTVIGPTSNRIRKSGDALWMVISGDNTIGRFDLGGASYTNDFIDVGSDQNPYDLSLDLDADEVWIGNSLGNQVVVAQASSGAIVARIEDPSLANPSSIALSDDHAYVANYNYLGAEGFGPGTVSVIARDTKEVVGAIAVEAQNVQFIEPREDALIVVATGALRQTLQGTVVESPGRIERWLRGDDVLSPQRQALEVPASAEIGAPGRPLFTDDGRAYLTSATSPVLLSFELATMTWLRGPEDPIRLAPREGDALHHGTIDDQGVLYISSFNKDALYLVDSRCDARMGEPLRLTQTPSRLSGPHGVAVEGSASQRDVYVIMSLSNVLTRLRLDFSEAR